jgi:hypothetical protein
LCDQAFMNVNANLVKRRQQQQLIREGTAQNGISVFYSKAAADFFVGRDLECHPNQIGCVVLGSIQDNPYSSYGLGCRSGATTWWWHYTKSEATVSDSHQISRLVNRHRNNSLLTDRSHLT